tara:strand:+ start:120423 stop:121100 length:678 start_codon:yes stop_codon:yes gene_type:complete
MLILVGSLGVLTLVWTLTWDKYQESFDADEGSINSEKKSSTKPPVYKRLPAEKEGQKVESSEDFKTSLLFKRLEERKPSSFKPSKIRVFKSGNQNFNLVEDLVAVKESERHNFREEDIVEKKFGHLIVKKASDSEAKNLIVQNARTKRLGILTGVFKIKLYDHKSWSEVQESYSLEEEANFPGIRLTLLKTNDLEKIESILAQISGDSRVERVELEILESPPVSN